MIHVFIDCESNIAPQISIDATPEVFLAELSSVFAFAFGYASYSDFSKYLSLFSDSAIAMKEVFKYGRFERTHK